MPPNQYNPNQQGQQNGQYAHGQNQQPYPPNPQGQQPTQPQQPIDYSNYYQASPPKPGIGGALSKLIPGRKTSYATPSYSSNTPRQDKLLKFAIVGGVLSVIIFAAGNLFGGGGSTPQDLSRVIGAHEEVARIASIGLNSDSATLTSRNAAATARAIASSHIKEVTDYAVSQTFTIDRVLTASFKDSSINDELQTAEDNNRFDAAFLASLEASMQLANQELTTAFNNTNETALSNGLSDYFDSNARLLGLLSR